ncbi:orotidine-5'-phosphate decarboxylase [Sphingobium sp. CCH11-B1]|jgi:orotidine-5'-phosphate decarboxylase|uniref:orotidine-5'-phosphate decarboxylase n=1 Tax=Sphingobium sp. CCH11-B1 TaxID=1768781 RepID=UPI000832ACB2|nr:orotidine-5'-phosphate decarboxylase [Sphingobium sp. CCH11-B1]MEA3389351.1 orotidine-5'-phosphate decarboxylase [Pseudomonadota bacterium]
MTSPVYVAIDTPDLAKAQALAAQVKRHVGGLKLGLEFFCANGHHGVHEMAKFGLPIFLDLKLHDIPNTVAKAVQALHRLEPAILTVHAAGGRAMLEDAKAAAGVNTKVVAVTVLTSLDDADLLDIGVGGGAGGKAEDQVRRLADLAQSAGLDGIVCSGEEVAMVKQAWSDGFFVVPGVRPAGGAKGDQKRAVTPREALDRGASILVVGRPISLAENPDLAAREIEATL